MGVTNKMKKIGLVGGTGPESTVIYYRELNRQIDLLTKEKQMPEIVIESVDFRKAWKYIENQNTDLLGEYLSEKVRKLECAGAEVISLTSVTMHRVFGDVCEKTKVSLVNLPKAIATEVHAKGYKKVGLLGTQYTMEQEYMIKALQSENIEVVIPDEADRSVVARRILEELEVGKVKESTLHEFQTIIRKMQIENGIEAVILGCTELPLLLNYENCPVPCFDSIKIHVDELIRQAIKN